MFLVLLIEKRIFEVKTMLLVLLIEKRIFKVKTMLPYYDKRKYRTSLSSQVMGEKHNLKQC